jgi:protein-arginine kinase activator protein McsA
MLTCYYCSQEINATKFYLETITNKIICVSCADKHAKETQNKNDYDRAMKGIK